MSAAGGRGLRGQRGNRSLAPALWREFPERVAEADGGREWLLEEFRAFERTMALRTAIELDLFTKIGAGRNTARMLAADGAANEHGIGVLCDYLATHGCLCKKGARYQLTVSSRFYLTRSSPAYMGSVVEFFASDEAIAAFSRLRHTVNRGRCAGRDALGERESYWLNFASSMAPLAQPLAEVAAAALRVDSAGPIQVLDIAAGHGLYGCEIAFQNPEAQIFALDSPLVLETASRNFRRKGLQDRYHALPGDALKVKFGRLYDLILAANFAHHLEPSANLRLFKKCRTALKPRGRSAVIEYLADPDGSAPGAESFGLHLLATSRRGKIYTFRELVLLLRAAGFGRIQRLKTAAFGNSILVAST